MNVVIEQPAKWSQLQKIGFRFFFCYIVIYIFPFPLTEIPGVKIVDDWYFELWDGIIPGIGKQIGWPVTARPGGSGDTSWNYVQVFLILAISVLATGIWSVIDGKRNNYNRLLNWFMIFVRYYLAFVMFQYGFAKVFKQQFPFPNLNRLVQPMSDTSPMGLTWAYMGQSFGYNIFTGLLEIAAGLLLLFRRTTLAGALLTMGIMANVVMMNFCYDIAVKLYSSFLLLVALFITVTNMRRLVAFFFFNTPVTVCPEPKLFRSKRANRIMNILGIVLVAYFVFGQVQQKINMSKQVWADSGPKSSLFGIYNLEFYIRNNDTLPLLRSDSTLWQRLVVDYWGSTLYKPNDRIMQHELVFDTAKRSAVFYPRSDTAQKSFLHYESMPGGNLLFTGRIANDSVRLSMKKVDMDKFPIKRKGFHWVRETTQ